SPLGPWLLLFSLSRIVIRPWSREIGLERGPGLVAPLLRHHGQRVLALDAPAPGEELLGRQRREGLQPAQALRRGQDAAADVGLEILEELRGAETGLAQGALCGFDSGHMRIVSRNPES